MEQKNISVIFPIAGLGSRFDYKFKPFIYATDYTFIELAKQPFDKLKNYGYNPTYYFIFRESQEKDYNITSRLNELFLNDSIHCCIISDTDGPLQTLQNAILKYNLSGNAFVCDCDHIIDILPLIPEIETLNTFEVIIPTWTIQEHEYHSFGKVKLNNNKIVDFCEKEYMHSYDCIIKGILGCYLFKELKNLLYYPHYENISSMLKDMCISNIPLNTIEITNAEFFGTPKQLQEFRFKRTKTYTIFIDIDGTLIHQTTKELLPGTLEQLNKWKLYGHKIILTTAIDTSLKDKLLDILNKYKIPYDQIITDLSPGPRYIINDRKPYLPYYNMAEGFNIDRNSGIESIQLQENIPIIEKIFQGASFAKVYLVIDNQNNKFVRKYISSNKNIEHVEILKRQCEDMKRLYFYKNSICPKILNEYSNQTDYYFDMEYLNGYKTLSKFSKDIILNIIPDIFNDLKSHVYCYQKLLSEDEKNIWFQKYKIDKIIPKFKIIESLHPYLYSLINQKNLIINSKQYYSYQYYLDNINHKTLLPSFLSPIHGDLTLENILYNLDLNDYKLIDPSGSRYMDAPELDIAKLFQSIICDYSSWAESCDNMIDVISINEYVINSKYIENKYNLIAHIFNKEDYIKGLFYMSTYFIRMVPFMICKSLNHARVIIILAIYYIANVHEQI